MKKSRHKISAKEFDEKFDQGEEDIIEHSDTENAQVHRATQRVNIDIPVNILKQIDEEAQRIGVARTALIKVWLSEKLEIVKHH